MSAPVPRSEEWPAGPFYTVKKGETLGEIAKKVLGSAREWERLHAANADRVPDPKRVQPGTRLVIPRSVKAPRD